MNDFMNLRDALYNSDRDLALQYANILYDKMTKVENKT